MQVSKRPMHIRFWSKTFKIFLYKFQGMNNNFKYEFHDKWIILTIVIFLK